MVLYGLFVVLPVGQAVQFSFYDWSGLAGNAKPVGFANYQQLFTDQIYLKTISHNILLVTVGGFFCIALALLTAHAIQGSGRVQKALRAFYLMPYVTSLVAVAVLWMFLFNPKYGLVSAILSAIGLGSWNVAWLGDQRTALPAVGATFIWYVLGFYVMLLTAGIQSIDQEVYEAGKLDGSEGWHRFRKLTWPLLWSIKRVAIMHYVIAAMNTFALVFLMTNGGPDRSSEVTMTYLYEQAFQNSRMGYSSTIAVTNLFFVLCVIAFIYTTMRKDPTGRTA